MASDYIYIFCIPGSGASETCGSSAFSAPADATLENNRRARSATVFPRGSTHAPPTNDDNAAVRSSCETTLAVGWSGLSNRPQSAVMDVPEDWAPLPARQRSGRTSSYRASFSGTTDDMQGHVVTVSGQPNAGAAERPSMVEDCFPYDICALPSYTSLQNRSSQPARDIALSPFYAVRWSPRATSSPVRESWRGLCDARAKACWRRVCNHECCMRCFVTVTTFRWLLLFFASVGAGCILSGVVLGLLYISLGTSFLVLSVMFMGMDLRSC